MKNKRIELILEEVNDNDSVLDVGCAAYDYAKGRVDLHGLLHKKARRVVGIDSVIPRFRKQAGIIIADAESMKLDEKFDLIIAAELIEHLSNPGKFLERARAHLRDGGRLILTTPNPWELPRLIRAALKIRSTVAQEHVCWYDEGTIANLVNRYGFKLERVEFVPRLPYAGSSGFTAVVERILSYISLLLYRVGLRRIAGMGLFVKCCLEEDASFNGQDNNLDSSPDSQVDLPDTETLP